MSINIRTILNVSKLVLDACKGCLSYFRRGLRYQFWLKPGFMLFRFINLIMKMKAYLRTRYGGPELLCLDTVEKPTVKKGHLLVRIAANSANPADWHILRGTPVLARLAFGLITPKNKLLGADFAGTVEEVGEEAGPFQAGDRVFGEDLKGGTFAEFAVVPATACAHMPEGSSFAAMAGMPVAGLTALQALITHGKLQKGESVLINGASGGVGHLAVQIARAYGARVTGVCSAKNRDIPKAIAYLEAMRTRGKVAASWEV